MSAPVAARIRGLSIGQRLTLGLAPALLAVILVVGLAYYGELGRQAPEYVVAGAAALAAVSLLVTWSNTRYLAQRIKRLAGGAGVSRSGDGVLDDDELGRIEQVVERLGTALAESEAERRAAIATGSARLQEQALMLGASVRDALARLDDVRLPLHILIDAPFGELNENQEELLVTARAAADAMDLGLRRLMLVADADRDALPVLIERVSVNDVLRGVAPMLRATTDRHGARVQIDLDPMLPRVMADRTRLAETLAMLGADAARAADEKQQLAIRTHLDAGVVWVRFAPANPATTASTPERMLAARLIAAQGGCLVQSDSEVAIGLPVSTTASPRLA
jgi:signal transduction histidine kinase